MKQMHNSESGQVGLVVLLITAILMTMGLGVISQSVIESKVARQEIESSQTFNVAEQGIEDALSRQLATTEGTREIPNVIQPEGYSVQVQDEARTTFEKPVFSGHSVQFSLSGTNDDQLEVKWAKSSDACDATNPSVIVTLLSADGLSHKRFAYRPPACAASRDQNFTEAPVVDGWFTTPRINTLGYTMARFKVLYGSTTLRASGLGSTIVQQNVITATATKDSGEVRSVQSVKSLPAASSIFDYVLFAGQGSIVPPSN